jgi:hypothetical protein
MSAAIANQQSKPIFFVHNTFVYLLIFDLLRRNDVCDFQCGYSNGTFRCGNGYLNKSEWNATFVTLLPLPGIASKELPPEVTIRKLSKFSQSEVTLTYCKLIAIQKWQLSQLPSGEPKRYVTVCMQSLYASSCNVAQCCVARHRLTEP